MLSNLVFDEPFFMDRQEKRETKLARKKRSATDIRTWLRERTSGVCFGKQITGKSGKHPIHCNKNVDVMRFYKAISLGFRPYNLERWTNKDFDRHVAGEDTFFFSGSHKSNKRLTLVNIDIDCKEIGNLDGAIAFAKWIRKHVFPNMYFEDSTNGKGAHGYIVVERQDLSPQVLNRLLLDRLDKFLKLCLAENDFDVENVEIKGLAPVFGWGQQKNELKSYQSGVLAKLPRLGSKTLEQKLRKTTHISAKDLLSNKLFGLLKLNKKKKGTAKNCLANNYSSASVSSTGIPINEEELDRLDDYLAVAKELLDGQKLRTSSRHIVKAMDVAIALMLGKCFSNNMNKDGSMPTKRFSSVWTVLANNGNVERGYNGKRLKVIRDFLTGFGLISWNDNKFVVSTEFDEAGNGTNGKACKWQFSEELMKMLDFDGSLILRGEEESIFRDTSINAGKNSMNWKAVVVEEFDLDTSPQQIAPDYRFYLASQRLYDDPTIFLQQAA